MLFNFLFSHNWKVIIRWYIAKVEKVHVIVDVVYEPEDAGEEMQNKIKNQYDLIAKN